MPDKEGKISTSPPGTSEDKVARGAVVTPIYASRNVMHYAVTDHELSGIAYLNSQTTIFASVGSFLLAIAVSIVISLLIEDENPDITLSLGVAAGIAFLLSVCLFGLAYHAWRARNSEINRIKEQGNE